MAMQILVPIIIAALGVVVAKYIEGELTWERIVHWFDKNWQKLCNLYKKREKLSPEDRKRINDIMAAHYKKFVLKEKNGERVTVIQGIINASDGQLCDDVEPEKYDAEALDAKGLDEFGDEPYVIIT